MRKLPHDLLPAALIGLLADANPARAAQCDPTVPVPCNPLNLSGGEGVQTMGDAIVIAIQFLLEFIGLVCLVFIVISGLRYITSSGREDQVTKAKTTLANAITGLLLCAVAYTIILTLEEVLTVR